MSKLFSTTVILLLCTTCMGAGNYNDQWKKGNTFYQQKQYDSAAFYYEQIASLKPVNTDIYYNLGNTYYRLNKVSLAVLNYERSLRINPDNKSAKDNLAATQSRISNHIQKISDIFFINWWSGLTHQSNATAWAIGALITFLLIIASVWMRRFTKNGYRIPIQIPGILGFLFFCLLIPAFVAATNTIRMSAAVVMEHDAPLMNSEQKGKPLALIPEGTTVKIRNEKGMWIEVELPDGRNGWILQNQLTKI